MLLLHTGTEFNAVVNVCFFCSIFILLSRESDGGAIFWTESSAPA